MSVRSIPLPIWLFAFMGFNILMRLWKQSISLAFKLEVSILWFWILFYTITIQYVLQKLEEMDRTER